MSMAKRLFFSVRYPCVTDLDSECGLVYGLDCFDSIARTLPVWRFFVEVVSDLIVPEFLSKCPN